MVIVILATAFIVGSLFAVLPSPRQISSLNLRELALTTLQTLDERDELSSTVFQNSFDPSWGYLETALAASLPSNVVYNLTVYDAPATSNGTMVYTPVKTMSNAQTGLGASSETASVLIPSSDVIFTVTPQKISASARPLTLYILNCSDANGWWITGYTAQTLAADLYGMLSPYFQTTILVNTTQQLGLLLNNTLGGRDSTNSVVINTFGEAVPIPAGYYTTKGYRSSDRSYANYTYTLGRRVNTYNWTWVSIVGYPFYYVTNTNTFSTTQNTYGIYGMRQIGTDGGGGPSGLNAFLRGLDNQAYSYDDTWITSNLGVVQLSPLATSDANYYGIRPSPYQTSTRALPTSIQSTYHLSVASLVFNQVGSYIAGATYKHSGRGSFTAIGLTRIPDIRISVLSLLMYYSPTLYRSLFTSSGTTRLVVLQLGLQGGG
jgi:hypothetical protein